MSDKRFVVVSLSVGTASVLGAFVIAICCSLVFLHQPSKPSIAVPNLPQGDLHAKETNDLKYGPVNLDAAKEVKQGILSRMRARREIVCQPVSQSNCSAATYAPRATEVPPGPAPSTPPTVCPDGDCNQGYMPLPQTTNTPDLGSFETEIEAVPPDDSGKMQLLVIGRPEQAPATWFNTDPTLARVKRSVSFTRIDPGSVMHRERYGYLGSEAPIVALSWGDGRSIYFADATNMPDFPDTLFEQMKESVNAARNARPAEVDYASSFLALANSGSLPSDCPDGNCPQIQPPNDGFRFPRLRPPSDGTDNPLLAVAEGFLKDSLTSGLWLVFSVVALGFVLVFAVLMLGAIILVVRSLT